MELARRMRFTCSGSQFLLSYTMIELIIWISCMYVWSGDWTCSSRFQSIWCNTEPCFQVLHFPLNMVICNLIKDFFSWANKTHTINVKENLRHLSSLGTILSHSPGWPQIPYSLASASWVLGLQLGNTMPWALKCFWGSYVLPVIPSHLKC